MISHPFFDTSAEHYECSHCEGVFSADLWAKNKWYCPDCGAGALDAHPVELAPPGREEDGDQLETG